MADGGNVVKRLAFILAAAGLCTACSTMHPAASRPTALGPGVAVFPAGQRSTAPQLRGTTLAGDSLVLSDVLGHGIVAVNVWASWCSPCRQEMPRLERAARMIRVVGIDERDHSGSARAFVASRGVTYPSLSDPDGRLLASLPMLPQTGVPSTLFLDRRGRVAARVVGPVDNDALRRIVRRLGGR
jgi:thiol-disulfide isomerase/thioredoxin